MKQCAAHGPRLGLIRGRETIGLSTETIMQRRPDYDEQTDTDEADRKRELWVERALFAILMVPSIVVCLQLASPSGLPGYGTS